MCLEAEVDCVSGEASQAPLCVGTATQRLRILKCSIDVLNSGTVSRFIHLYGQVWEGLMLSYQEVWEGLMLSYQQVWEGLMLSCQQVWGEVNIELPRGMGGVNVGQ